MAIDEEILTKFHELKNTVNDIHNLDEVFEELRFNASNCKENSIFALIQAIEGSTSI